MHGIPQSMPTKQEIRKETHWLKKCSLIYLYHNSKAHGTKRPNKWKISDTAGELEYSSGYISEAIFISLHSEKVEKCQSREEALKELREIKYSSLFSVTSGGKGMPG